VRELIDVNPESCTYVHSVACSEKMAWRWRGWRALRLLAAAATTARALRRRAQLVDRAASRARARRALLAWRRRAALLACARRLAGRGTTRTLRAAWDSWVDGRYAAQRDRESVAAADRHFSLRAVAAPFRAWKQLAAAHLAAVHHVDPGALKAAHDHAAGACVRRAFEAWLHALEEGQGGARVCQVWVRDRFIASNV
jgi:hypothetical protein